MNVELGCFADAFPPIVDAIALHISTCFGFRLRAAQGTDQPDFAGLTKVGPDQINTFFYFTNLDKITRQDGIQFFNGVGRVY